MGSAARHGLLVVHGRTIPGITKVDVVAEGNMCKVLKLVVARVRTVGIWTLVSVSKTWFLVVLSNILERFGSELAHRPNIIK